MKKRKLTATEMIEVMTLSNRLNMQMFRKLVRTTKKGT